MPLSLSLRDSVAVNEPLERCPSVDLVLVRFWRDPAEPEMVVDDENRPVVIGISHRPLTDCGIAPVAVLRVV